MYFFSQKKKKASQNDPESNPINDGWQAHQMLKSKLMDSFNGKTKVLSPRYTSNILYYSIFT